jgi:hypothetical protein
MVGRILISISCAGIGAGLGLTASPRIGVLFGVVCGVVGFVEVGLLQRHLSWVVDDDIVKEPGPTATTRMVGRILISISCAGIGAGLGLTASPRIGMLLGAACGMVAFGGVGLLSRWQNR